MSSNNINDNTQTLNNDDLNFTDSHKPWTTVIRGKSTCTANMSDIQKELLDNNQQPITREDIATALQNRNLLRQTKTIQISSNIKYVSIQFQTSQLMETFCTEPLTVKENLQITFLPDFRKKLRIPIEPTYISFLNVPSEADEEALTQFVQQFATVLGFPRYPTKTHGDIEYFTGTRIYRVIKITKHIPRFNFLFGRHIKCIYTGQPEQRNFQRRTTTQPDYTERPLESETDTETQSDTDTHIDSDSSSSDTETNNTEPHNRNRNKTHINTNQQINNQTNSKEKPNPDIKNKQLEKQNENTPTNTKRQVNQHLQNNQNNITNRRNQPVQKQTQNKEEYWIDNIPPELTEKHFPPINQKDTLRQNDKQHNQEQQQQETTVIEEKPQSRIPQGITVIQETSESQLPQQNDKDLQFLSPPMVVTISTKTPEAINTSTPTIQTNPSTKPKQYNTSLLNPVLHNKGKIIPQEKIQE